LNKETATWKGERLGRWGGGRESNNNSNQLKRKDTKKKKNETIQRPLMK